MTLRLARILAGRRLFPGAAPTATTDRVVQTAPSSHATLPGWSIRPRYHAKDRHDVGAPMARTRAHRAGSRRRVRISGPASSLVDGDRRADHRGALVGPTVLWPDQADGYFGRHRGRSMTRSLGSTRRHARVRCAIYTRKSSEEGLDQEFNSLQAQREACEAFINSQRHEGWVCLPACYDDGGFSGATMDRPALQRLLADITAGRVDIVVIYKIDRLTRSLADFAKSAVYKQNQWLTVSNLTTLFRRLRCEKVAPSGQFEAAGR